MENSKNRVKFIRRQTDLDMWLEMNGALVAMEVSGKEKLYLPVAGSR